MNKGVLCVLVIVAVFVMTASANPPKKCNKNEVWSDCGKACEGTCENPNPKPSKMCVKGCVCQNGLLRNNEGKCVRPCDCKCCDK